jgi:hypothetical protein
MTDTSQTVPEPESLDAEHYGNPFLGWLLGLAIAAIVTAVILFAVGTNQNRSSFDETAGLGLLAASGTLGNAGGLALLLWLASSGVVRGLTKKPQPRES